jgi:RNA polymerase sigma-70 factor (ECF subfamily)
LTASALLWNGAFSAASTAAGAMRTEAEPRAETRATAAAHPVTPVAHPRADAAMDRYAQGDDAAFATLYAELAPRLRGFLLRLSGDGARAADLVQETFLRMHRARGAFAAGGAVLPWALAIARNAYVDHVRKRARGDAPLRAGREPDDEDETAELPSGAADGEQLVIAREAAETVRATLAALPVSQREAFVLLRFEGLSVADAAEVLGATPTAVKLRAFRAYEALRAALARRDSGAPGEKGRA